MIAKLRRLALAAAAALLIATCGQKGPLELPEEPRTDARAQETHGIFP